MSIDYWPISSRASCGFSSWARCSPHGELKVAESVCSDDARRRFARWYCAHVFGNANGRNNHPGSSSICVMLATAIPGRIKVWRFVVRDIYYSLPSIASDKSARVVGRVADVAIWSSHKHCIRTFCGTLALHRGAGPSGPIVRGSKATVAAVTAPPPNLAVRSKSDFDDPKTKCETSSFQFSEIGRYLHVNRLTKGPTPVCPFGGLYGAAVSG